MNKYDIQKVVGQGSYGRAILCKRKNDNKLCIIKQIALGKLSRHEAKMTEQEAALLHKLQHPNIVAFWESFVANSNLHIVMEYADGGDLENYIKSYMRTARGREMPEAQVLNIFVQLCLAIKHIHDRKILHRDLKCQNVFMTSAGICKLGDFGVSRVLRSTVELAATQIGTPYYMSPEIMNNQKYNSKTDIWSLGIILYELVCLRLPFQGNSMKQLCYNIINSNPVPPSSAYSKEMRELVRDILAKDPRKRPGVNNILGRPIMKDRIKNFLNETKLQREFCHTILHGVDVLRSNPNQIPPAPQPQPRIAPPIQQNHLQLQRPVVPIVAPPQQAAKVAAPPPPVRQPVPIAQLRQPMAPQSAPPPHRPAPLPMQRQPSQNEMKPQPSAAAINRVPSAPAFNKPAVIVKEEVRQVQVRPAPPVPIDRRIPQDAPKKVQDIIANMLKPPIVIPNNPPPRAVPLSNYAAVKEAAKVPNPSNDGFRGNNEKRPDSAPSRPPVVKEPMKAPIPVYRKPDDKPENRAAAANPFEAVVGKAIRPQSANVISRPISANPVIAQPKPQQQPQIVIRRDAPPILANRNIAVPQQAAPKIQVDGEKKGNPADRMKDLDDAMGKAAAVMNLVKQEKERLVERKAPVPVQQPSVAARRAFDPPKPVAISAAPTGQPWLANLQNQMGALQIQMQKMQAEKTPQSSDPQAQASPGGFPVNSGADDAVRQRYAAIAAMRNQNKDGNQRQSFPLAPKKEDAPPVQLVSQKQNVAKVPIPSHAAVKPKSKLSPTPAPSKAGVANRRLSDPIPQNHQLKVKVSEPKVVVKAKPVPTPESKESLEQRKELREKHRADFKKFLQQQKVGKNGSIATNEYDGDDNILSEDSINTETPTPRVNIIDRHSHLTPEVQESISPMPSEESQVSSDKRRRSGGFPVKASSDDLKSLHEEERAHLRRLIQEKRRQTPQQTATEAEVVVLVNKDYENYVEMFRQQDTANKRHLEDKEHRHMDNFSSPSPRVDKKLNENQSEHVGKSEDIWTNHLRATAASPISRRHMAMELDEEVSQRAVEIVKDRASIDIESESLMEASTFDLLDDQVPSVSESQDGFLGESFITELNQNPNLVDPQAALEYSMMLDQMQQILQLPSKHQIREMDQRLEQIAEDDEDEIEEGFEEESVQLEMSDDFDDGRDSFSDINEPTDVKHDMEGFNESDDMLLGDSDLYITDNDPFGNTVADLTQSLNHQAEVAVSADESNNHQRTDTEIEIQYVTDLQNRLLSVLGKEKFYSGINFLSSTLLVDEAADDDQLLSMLEDIIGTENLQYIEDLYQIISYQQN